MSIEQLVRDEFGDRLETVVAPAVDAAGLVARGRRHRRNRRMAIVVGGVAVVAVAGGVRVARDDSPAVETRDVRLPVVTSGATGPLAVEGPPQFFYTRDKVWIDGVAHPAGNFPDSTGPHLGQLGVAYPAQGSGQPHLLGRDGIAVPLAPAAPANGGSYRGWVAADGLTPLVAWAERVGDSVDLVAFDTGVMREIARKRVACQHSRPVPEFDDPGGEWLCPTPYVADSGVVFVHDGGTTFAWRPADGTWQSLGPGLVKEASNQVVDYFTGDRPDDIDVLGDGWQVLRLAGPHWAEQALHGDIEAHLSRDGLWVTDANGVRVENWQHPEETVTYAPPGEVVASQFDADGSVLYVTRTHGLERVWDCSVDSGCEAVTEPLPESVLLVAWDS